MEGCPYRENIVELAAHSRNVDCLKYLVEEQLLLMNNELFIAVMLRCDLSCVLYLVDQGCPYLDADFSNDVHQWETYDGMLRKDKPEFVECVKYAVERGWVPGEIFLNYIVPRNEPCKQWLISEGHYTNA